PRGSPRPPPNRRARAARKRKPAPRKRPPSASGGGPTDNPRRRPRHPTPKALSMRYLTLAGYVAIPVTFLVHLWLGKGKSWEPTATFTLAALGVIPLAQLMGEAT